MLVTTDAVVLKTMKYRDTSRLVTFYSQRFGKVRGIAKGARSLRNKFGSSLDPLSRVVVVLYHKEHRDLHLISQCDLAAAYHLLTSDFDRMASAMACLELVDQTSHDEERKSPLYHLLVDTLESIDRVDVLPQAALTSFKMHLAKIHGFAVSVGECRECHRSVESLGQEWVWFHFATGTILCGECHRKKGATEGGEAGSASSMRITQSAGTLLATCNAWNPPAPSCVIWKEEEGNEIQNALRLYLRYHLESVRPLKSEEMIVSLREKHFRRKP